MATGQTISDEQPRSLLSRLFPWAGRGLGTADDGTGRSLGTRWWEWTSYGVLLAIALGMRLWDLGSRAIHHDESLHSFYSWQLSDGMGFVHNPMMHGPLQFEANAAIFLVLGDTDYTSRLLYAVVGTALVLLPFFFRERLGRPGAIFVSGMLAFSPSLLYFSRFARNDILMAAWTLGLVICIWRYMDEGRNRYLYVSAVLLALAFSTKETSYLVTAMFSLYLAFIVLPVYWSRISQRVEVKIGESSPPAAIGRVISTTWSYFQNGFKLSELNRPGAYLLVLVTLTLPLWSAAVSIFQDTALLRWTNLTLVNPEGVSPIGAASGGGMVIAALVVIAFSAVSIIAGAKWRWGVWWRCAVIFYTIWVLLYTTFLTNIDGIGSGVWQGLGYWIAQQDVARGSQPFYYYLVITPVYEFLPLLFGIVASVYYVRKRDRFGIFLAFWSGLTFLLYTLATEKMPWLLVNITVPLIVISGRFLGELVESIQWRILIRSGAVLAIVGVPLFILALWQLAFFEFDGALALEIPMFIGLLIGLGALAAGGVFLARRSGRRNFVSFAAVPLALMLLVLTVRAGVIASYKNGDTPVEMLVYTQTSPDITRLMKQFREAAGEGDQQAKLPITIDQTSGFTWPWAWYLRGYERVDYPSYAGTPLEEPPDTPVVLVHSQNRSDADLVLEKDFTDGELIKHRWWFPESTYRGLTIGKVIRGAVDRQTWRAAMDYWLYREGVRDRIGSEDAYVYFTAEFLDGLSGP